MENLDVEIKSLVGVSFDFKGYFSFFGEIRNSRTSLHRLRECYKLYLEIFFI